MLSVVLYGRNDSHGYNLHKRGAISLNAIAELLRAPDDELIFVDYNTPDDLPTFPEAIADTLTDQAKAKLRILRVRPAQHARFAARTHLMALEPVARNVAVRRSNPANRWVLSTNTDMIFVPHAEGASLGDMVGALEDGFYHLPRFELPEALWESLDRKDAAGIIRSAGDWGRRFQLDEVVRSAGDNLFDGPGDFQLFLRDDLFRIGGFHEEMLKGWHVDANVARRMRLLRGPVRSAEPLLRGYHCDHTRQASPYHKGDRVENDPVRFVHTVERPEIAAQLQGFGLADETIEEVRLGQGSSARYLAALEAAVPAGGEAPLEAAYVADAFGQLAYPLDHVLPYLFDLVSCIPQNARIGYLGARPDTFSAFAKGWAAMGGEHPPLVPAEADWLAAAGPPLAAWAESADVFVFEVGAEHATWQSELTPEERARLWLVNRGMAEAFRADATRQGQGAPARRAIVVNAIHNSFEAQLFRHLSVTLTPYSSRIRHGFIVDPDKPRPAPTASTVGAERLGRSRPPEPQEVKLAADAVRASLDASAPTPEARSLAGLILALADAGAAEFSPRTEALTRLLHALQAARPDAAALPVGASAWEGPGAPTRFARLEDWSDPDFLGMAYALFPNRRHTDPAERIAWSWERTALAVNLDAAQPLSRRPRVLVVAALPELLAFMLSNLGARVDIADPAALAEGRLTAADFRDDLVRNTTAVPASAEPIGLIDDHAAEIAEGFRYDAVVVPENALFVRGRDGSAALMRTLSELVRPGGHLGLAAFALVNAVEPARFGDNIPLDLVREARWLQLLAAVGLPVQGFADAGLSRGSLDTLSPEDGEGSAIPALLLRDGPALRAPAVVALTKAGEGDEEAWSRLDRALRTGWLEGEAAPAADTPASSSGLLTPADLQRLQRLALEAQEAAAPGSLLRKLTAGPGVEKTPRAARSDGGREAGLALYGALGPVDPGRYDLRVQGSAETEAGAPLTAVVVGREGVLASAPVLHEGTGPWSLDFEVKGQTPTPLAFALVAPVDARFAVLDVTLA